MSSLPFVAINQLPARFIPSQSACALALTNAARVWRLRAYLGDKAAARDARAMAFTIARNIGNAFPCSELSKRARQTFAFLSWYEKQPRA